MSDLDLAITHSKKLEALLRSHLGAAGRGLHELTDDVEHKLPPEIVRKLRFVATLRNKLVHDADYHKLDDRRGFVRAAEDAEHFLAKLADKRALFDKTFLIVAAGVLLALVVGVGITVFLLLSHD